MSGATRGIYLERQVAELMSKRGWFVIRAAGSHGIADVVGILPGRVALIQCKTTGAIGGGEWNRLWEAARWLEAVPVLAQWHHMSNGRGVGGIVFLEVTGVHVARSQSWPHMPWAPDRVPLHTPLEQATAEQVQALELERLGRPRRPL